MITVCDKCNIQIVLKVWDRKKTRAKSQYDSEFYLGLSILMGTEVLGFKTRVFPLHVFSHPLNGSFVESHFRGPFWIEHPMRLFYKILSQFWWCISTILSLRKLRQEDLEFRAMLGLYSKFQVSLGYIKRPCFTNTN